jgi:cytoskeletal protein CcmA (bactofilin family)
VTVHGTVHGDVVAEQGVKLGPEARVEGDLTCRSLAIEEGAFFAGRSIMSAQTQPSGGRSAAG